MSNHRIALWIARRYLFTRRHQHASFINWVSFGGLSLGVMILTVVVSVMNGFDRELSTRLLGAV
ncbi:MAG: lipoprotein-releasing system transmembrane subunit LolC, partial [Gammaproteobacteria bacterium]|nr:lipoprotein-releasing system transmembrane subunit LolC [Gammaproteobacteria bacterium]